MRALSDSWKRMVKMFLVRLRWMKHPVANVFAIVIWKHLWCWCLGAARPNARVYLHVHSHHLGVVIKVSHYAQ